MKVNIKSIAVIFIAALMILTGAACSGPKADDPDEAKGNAAEETEQQGEQEETAENEEPADEGEEEPEMSMEEILDKITINTQSSIRIEGSSTIYVDPFKRADAPHDADMILITHAHYDHFDPPSLKNVANNNTLIICPGSMENDVAKLGIGSGITALDAVQDLKLDSEPEAVKVEAVPAYNLNKNFHPKANGWVGYIITMDGVTYYAAGDTDALPELEDVRCDVAFVPVGGTYTMTAPEAAGLINKISPKAAVPVHYGTIVGRAQDAVTFRDAVNKDIDVVTKVEDAK